jgi:hypothetical protein
MNNSRTQKAPALYLLGIKEEREWWDYDSEFYEAISTQGFLNNCLALLASSMPPLGIQCVTHRINIAYEHSNYMNFTLHNEQNRRQDNVHRPRTGYPVLLMLMCSHGNCNHANPFGNRRSGANRFHRPYRQYPRR